MLVCHQQALFPADPTPSIALPQQAPTDLLNAYAQELARRIIAEAEEEYDADILYEQFQTIAEYHAEITHPGEVRQILREHPEYRNNSRRLRDTHVEDEAWHWFYSDLAMALYYESQKFLPLKLLERLDL